MEYSPVADAAFCFSCRCFSGNEKNSGQIEKTFITTGFNSWYRATTKFKKHQISKFYINRVAAMDNYCSNKSIDEIIDNSVTLQLSKKENERLKNRELMKRLIDVIICLTKSGKPLRGHDESDTSHQKGLFLEVINLLSKYDVTLKTHLEKWP